MSCSFVFVPRVCERPTTHSLISFYCFQFLRLLENCLFCFLAIRVRLLLTSVSSFQGPILAVACYNRWRKGFICQSSDECDLNQFSLSEECFLGISAQEWFRVALSPPLGFVRVPPKSTLPTSEFLANVCIIEHSEPPFWQLQSSSIICSHVNCYLVRFKFKYENVRTLSQVLEEGHL